MRSMGEVRGGRALAETSRPLTYPIRLRSFGATADGPLSSPLAGRGRFARQGAGNPVTASNRAPTKRSAYG
jgi:hypothetical protein